MIRGFSTSIGTVSDTPLSAEVDTEFRRQVAVDQSV
jgi:hypothetical protein